MSVSEQIKSNFPFENFRDNQYDIIDHMVTNLKDADNYILEASTGTGKSVIAYTAAKTILENMESKKSDSDSKLECFDCEDDDETSVKKKQPKIIFCTLTKQLQNQYIDSFKSQKDTSFIWSARNYKCSYHLDSNNTPEAVYYGSPGCQGKKCPMFSSCEFILQKKEFYTHNIGIVNYHYFLHNCKLTADIVVFDECQEIENILADIATVTISSAKLIKFTNCLTRFKSIKVPNNSQFLNQIQDLSNNKGSTIDEIKSYIKKFITTYTPIVLEATNELNKELESNNKFDPKLIKIGKIIDNLSNHIDKYSTFLKSNTEWVVSHRELDIDNYKIVIKPLDVYEFFHSTISSKCKKMIFMSATICGKDVFSSNLGLTNYVYNEVSAVIPVQNRQVYFINNIGSLNFRNKEKVLPNFVKVIDHIIGYHRKHDKSVNGVIHSVSYANAEFIKKHSKYKKDIIIPTAHQKNNIPKLVKSGNKILVSPSMMAGIDLYDNLSRFQILLKVPYLNLGDVWIKTKMQLNNMWYTRNAVINIIQCSGRSIRSVEDYANTYILDGNFNRLLNQNKVLFPNYYLDAIQSVQF